MYPLDVDTLTVMQQERCRAFTQQAARLRLLRTQQATTRALRSVATSGRKPHRVIAALQQLVMRSLAGSHVK